MVRWQSMMSVAADGSGEMCIEGQLFGWQYLIPSTD